MSTALDPAAFERALAQLEAAREPGFLRRSWQDFRAIRSARAAATFLALAALLALAAPLLPLRSPIALDLAHQAQAPCWPWQHLGDLGFRGESWELGAVDSALAAARRALFGEWQLGPWLGTDVQGRDVLARLVWGARTSLFVALAAALTSLSIGVAWGAISALAGGKVDALMMRVVDALQSLPTILLVVFLLAFVGSGRGADGREHGLGREQAFFLAIGSVNWLSMARVVRGQVLSLRRSEFVLAARAFGASNTHLLRVHVLPHVLPIAAVYLTLSVPSVVMYEAFLSFLGLGIESPKVSLGLLASDGMEAINPLRVSWWLVVTPAVALGTTLLALSFVGDGLRDALDPRSRAAGRSAARP